MEVRTLARKVLSLLFASAVLVTAASQAGAATASTKITKLTAKVSATSIAVTGKATFGGEKPNTLATDPAGDEPGDPAGSQIGIDMLGANIYQPDPKNPCDPAPYTCVQFGWEVAQLPPTGSVPEVIRYLFDVFVNGGPGAGGSEYLIQAKYSNVVSSTVTDDPQGHLMHIGNAFQIRGHCAVVGVVNSCPHLAWLNGAFDVEHGVVYIGIPLGQDYAPDLKPGAVLTSSLSGFDTAACIQAGVSNANTCDNAAWSTTQTCNVGGVDTQCYQIPQSNVKLGIAKAGTPVGNVNFSTNATLKPTGAFSGKLSRAGLGHGKFDVWAKACFGNSCATMKKTVTL